jgi:predicted PurR-regulated permease PerM
MTLITAALYWARAILIPVALAILLAFLLTPVVVALQRRGLGRVLSVILVAVLAFAFLGGISWVVGRQFVALINDLPSYEDNIKRKIADIRSASKGAFFEKAQKTVEEIEKELQESEQPAAKKNKPIPVVVQPPSMIWRVPVLLEPLATAGLVIVLVLFMLLDRGDLRNRFIRLVGYGRLTVTTKALDEAGKRISRYLLMHSLLNGSQGLVLGIGLWLIGLPYALLWGVLTALLRFIPYAGPVVAALFPSFLSLTVFPGWQQPLMVIGLILLLELISNMIMEPLLYGRTAGVSEVLLMVAIAFWTWLWGPIGLLLATPLTVSLGVLGRYVPQLEFLGVLLSDEPALETHTSYYQRLVARDQDEAEDLLEEYLQTHTLAEACDAVLVPALHAAKKDLIRGNLSDEDMLFIVQTTHDIVEDMSSHTPQQTLPETTEATATDLDHHSAPLPKVQVVGCPARDQADELALFMLQQLLDPRHFEFELLPATMLVSEIIAFLDQQQPGGLLCLGILAPGGMAQARYLCKRLRARDAETKIVVGRWGLAQHNENSENLLLAAGADYIGITLQETCAQIAQLESVVRSMSLDRLQTESQT